MAESLRAIKNRIHGVESVEKLTAAMKMVATSKLRSLQKKVSSCGEYFLRTEEALKDLLASQAGFRHELFISRPGAKKRLVCVFSSDMGLCGAYNNAVFNFTEKFIREGDSREVSLAVVGRKGFSHFKKKGFHIVNSYLELYSRYSDKARDQICRDLTGAFLKKEADEVYVAYTDFISASRHKPVAEKILNIEPPPTGRIEYIIEPDIASVVSELAPRYLSARVRHIILKAFAAEQAMRVMAMTEATDNARELLEGLILNRNKIRQADITTQIIEIISSGSEALKG